MGGLVIGATARLPGILLDSKANIFQISGVSMPDNGKEFFEPVLTWLEVYSVRPNKETELLIHLEYFNLSTSKAMLFMFYQLSQIQDAGYKVKVIWCYRDAYILSAGRDYAYMVKIPFEFRKVTAKDPAHKEASPDFSLL